ncbi:MAG: metal-dependent transcriptional regulator [Chitinophagaceae bacterium]|nr:metal-dependent transcriptional regulator [Chitinophagaceae bacterium]
MTTSYTAENYLKAIYHLGIESGSGNTSTNSIAEYMLIKPATVTAMLKKLKEKKFISYEKYGKVSLTKKGLEIALYIVRKHRLWEVFLVEKLHFTWDEIHVVAEQLEHIQSTKLIDQLDAYLGFPELDPHGDPIPDQKGVLKQIPNTTLHQASEGKEYQVVAVKDTSTEFLQYLMQLQITLSTRIKVVRRIQFDQSLLITVNGGKEINVSEKFSHHIIISL